MIKLKMLIKFPYKLILFFLLISSLQVAKGQVIGDYISIVSGNWPSSTTWGVVTGTGPLTWSAAPGQPAAGNNVFIRSGHNVIITSAGSFCTNLTVEPTGKIYSNNTTPGTPIYISVSGNITCNGQIGNSPTYDNISFNIESASCLISGTGLFDACRLRKNGSAVATTNLTISMDINLWFAGASTTQLYNNSTNGVFNMTISVGSTVNLLASGPTTGHCSIDGINGVTNTPGFIVEAGGTFTINGTLNISGIMYISNNNTTSTYKCTWIINGLVRASEISAAASATDTLIAGTSLKVNAGGRLEITGTPAWSTLSPTNNSFTFASGSTVEYSAAGNQVVRVPTEFKAAPTVFQYYGNLIMSNSGNKTTSFNTLYVKNDLTISGAAVFVPFTPNSTIRVGGNWYNYNQSGFTESSSTVIFNNGASIWQYINCPGGEVFNTLQQISPNNFLLLNCPVTANVFGLGAANGHLDLNSNSLTINNTSPAGILGGATIRFIVAEKTDNSSKVIWKIGTGIGWPLGFIIPFGVPGAPSSYIPVTIFKQSASAVGDISVSTYGTPATNLPWPSTPTTVSNLQAYIGANNTPDNRSWCVDRFWQVDATGSAPVDSIKFSYRTAELPTSDPVQANMKAQFWAGPFGFPYWNLSQYGVPALIGNAVSVPNFTYYNTAWTLSSIASPLPIELLHFGATKKEKSVELEWSTATEINNELFVLERSIDGSEFYPIGSVVGAGNSTQQLNYTFSDKEPLYGISYYRLKQIDFDGKFSYSKIVAINFNSAIQDVVVFPNPASKIVYITAKDLSNSSIIISDVAGRILKTEKISDSKLSVYPLEILELLPGIYQLQVVRDSEQETVQLVIN